MKTSVWRVFLQGAVRVKHRRRCDGGLKTEGLANTPWPRLPRHVELHHLANANKFDHIRRVNGILGLFVPALVTPLELLGGSDDQE